MAQNFFEAKDSITFIHKGTELTLYSKNLFKFKYKIYSCLDSTQILSGTVDGNYKIEKFKLFLNQTSEGDVFFQEPYLILPIKNQTFLISSKDEEIKRIKSIWTKDYDESFFDFLIRENRESPFFYSNKEIKLSLKHKKKVYNIFE